MIVTFLFFLFLSHTQAQDSGSDKIWNDNDCPHVENKKDCQDAECCKAHCTNDKNCTAVNFKPGDCVLRACKCTGVVPPTWVSPPHKGYSIDGSVDGSDKLWKDEECPHLEINKDCQDVECCKTACKAKDKCTAVNFKPGDCVLRGCKCTGLVEPSWENTGYKGYVVTDLLGLYRFNKNEIKLEKNKKLDELPYMGKEFSVSFDLFLDSYPAADVPFASVLHLTLGENMAKMGDRIPAVWIMPSKEIHVVSAVSGQISGQEKYPVESGKWVKMEINQKLVGGKYMFEVLINGESKRSEENTTPAKYDNIKVFAGDDWYPAADGKIRNLMIATS